MIDVRLRPSSTLVVRETAEYRELVEIGVHEMVHTRVRRDAPLVSGFAYTDAMHLARGLISRERPRVLCLGAGGCIVPQQLAPFASFVDVVEHAPEVLELAMRCFVEEALFDVHLDDAATFLERGGSVYDLILIDLFGPFEASPLLVQPAFFASVRAALADGGAIAVNTVGALDGSNGAMTATMHAIHAAFGSERTIALPMLQPHERSSGTLVWNEPRNVVALATTTTTTRLPACGGRAVEDRMLPHLPVIRADLERQLLAVSNAKLDGANDRPIALACAAPAVSRRTRARGSPARRDS